MNINKDILNCIIEYFDCKQLIISRSVNKTFYNLCKKYYVRKNHEEFIKDFNIEILSVRYAVDIGNISINYDQILLYPTIFKIQSNRSFDNYGVFMSRIRSIRKNFLFYVHRNGHIFIYDVISESHARYNTNELIKLFLEYGIIDAPKIIIKGNKLTINT